MRIAYFVDRFPQISETFVLGQICGMIDKGHEVTIFADYLVQADVQHAIIADYELLDKAKVLPAITPTFVQRLPTAFAALTSAFKAGQLRVVVRSLNSARYGRDATNLKVLLRAAPHFGSRGYDILHCQFGQLGVWVQRLRECGVLPGALVTSFRGTDAMKFATQDPDKFARLFAGGDRFLPVSHAVRRRLVELSCREDKITVLRSGVDLEIFQPRADCSLHNPVRLLSVARLAPIKGLEYALEATKLLLEAGYRVEYRLLGDGPLTASLQGLVKTMQLDEHVVFEGRVESRRVVEALNGADILLAPSITGDGGEQEGLPNSLKEAMAIGVPAIGTNTGGIPELIEDGVNGFIVDEKDASAIAERIKSLLGNWDAMGEIVANGRRTIEQQYDLRQLNGDLEQIYLETAQCKY